MPTFVLKIEVRFDTADRETADAITDELVTVCWTTLDASDERTTGAPFTVERWPSLEEIARDDDD